MKLSVVIPALEEAEHIEAAVLSALPEAAKSVETGTGTPQAPGSLQSPHGAAIDVESPIDVEVWVVDGGSRDATRARAEAAGARVLDSPPGRALQLERGARAAAGEVLLFLHADSRLPRGWARAVRDALRDEGVVGGAFGFAFDAQSPALRFIAFGAWLRNRLFALPYGDQGLFVRRRVLEAVGGVPQTPILEDLELVAAMKRRGRLALLPEPVVTSARRYLAGGPLRTMLRHWGIAARWALGVSPARLAERAAR